MEHDRNSIARKKENLVSHIKQLKSLAVGFSGGVDSTLLLAVAKEALGDAVIAMTAQSPTHPLLELNHAKDVAGTLGVKHVVFPTLEMKDGDFTANGPERCYHCKKILFKAMRKVADDAGIENLAHGANLDDMSDHRPGFKAAEELEVRAPLIETAFSKSDIRRLAEIMGLPNWDRPAMACLATRIPYGVKIEEATLRQIETAEALVLKTGVRSCRVRHHGNLARIEIDMDEKAVLMDQVNRRKIMEGFRSIGYQFVCLDLEGYLTGKMNRELNGPPA